MPRAGASATRHFRPGPYLQSILPAIWAGNVIHGKTLGVADGAPAADESHSYWAWDKKRHCMRAVFVDNMGPTGEMEVRWVGDQLVSTELLRDAQEVGLAQLAGRSLRQSFLAAGARTF